MGFFDSKSSNKTVTNTRTDTETNNASVQDNAGYALSNLTDVQLLDGGAIGQAFGLAEKALENNLLSFSESLNQQRALTGDVLGNTQNSLDTVAATLSGDQSDSIKKTALYVAGGIAAVFLISKVM